MMRWLSRIKGYVLMALIIAAGIWASLQRGKAARLTEKARQEKREHLDQAEVHGAQAATAAARANEALARQNVQLKNLEKSGDKDIADRARIINERMRDAARSRS